MHSAERARQRRLAEEERHRLKSVLTPSGANTRQTQLINSSRPTNRPKQVYASYSLDRHSVKPGGKSFRMTFLETPKSLTHYLDESQNALTFWSIITHLMTAHDKRIKWHCPSQ